MQDHSLSSLWSVSIGKPILCVSSSSDGSQIAVGTSTACLVVDAKTGSREFYTEKNSGPVVALSFAKENEILVGAQGVLRLWDFKAAKVLATLELCAKTDLLVGCSELVVLAAQPDGDLFGVAAEHGRKVFIVSADLRIHSELELQPNCGKVNELCWLSRTALLVTSTGGIQGWIYTEENSQPSLVLGKSIGLVVAKSSPDRKTLAAGSRDGVVYLWSLLEGNTQQGADALSAQLRSTLKDYNDEVQILRWDTCGKYLATADGSEATIWDVSKLFERSIQSIVCCGHEPGTAISCAAFQTDGTLLATGGSDGKVLFYDSGHFQMGQVCQPCAAAQSIPSGDGISCLTWLPGGQLVAGSVGGKVIGWQLQAEALEEQSGSPSSERVDLSAGGSETSGSRTDQPDGQPNGFSKRPLPKIFAKPAKHLSDVKANPESGSGQPSRSSRSSTSLNKDHASGNVAMERNLSLPPSSKTVREGIENSRQSLEDLSIDDSKRSKSLQDSSGQGLSQRVTSLERQQLSPSLMQHIQRVQQKPTATARHREPAGWGMGSTAAAASSSQYVGGPGPSSYNAAAAGAAPGQLQQQFMMFSNQAAALQAQGMMPAYAFPHSMAHMPLMPHTHAHPQQGYLGGKVPAGMVYMPMGAAMPQQQWQVMGPPWMGHYYLHPSQQALPEHLSLMAAGRSTSAPDAHLPYQWAGRPVEAAAAAGGMNPQPDQRDDLRKNAISLPKDADCQWQKPAAALEKSPPQAAAEGLPANVKRMSMPGPEGEGAGGAGPGKSKEFRETGNGKPSHLAESHAPLTKPSKPPVPEGVPAAHTKASTVHDLEMGVTDASNSVLTIYVGNLPPTVDEVALMVPFSYFGTISNIQVIRDKNSLQSRGFAFVSYAQPICAAAAIQNMNGRILYGSFRGRALKVGPSNRVI